MTETDRQDLPVDGRCKYVKGAAWCSCGTWTIAYRTRRANHFRRVTNWSGTWRQNYELARKFGELHPELQVFYVPSAAYERDEFERITGLVVAGAMAQDAADKLLADHGTVMAASGKRVKIRETGILTHQELALAMLADDAAAHSRTGVAS